MAFPALPQALRLERLQPPAGRIRMVLDTDTYNEIDDQFAVVYSLLSQDRLDVEALYAAPFHNDRSSGPGDGMEKSYEEILRLLQRLDVSPEGLVHRGSPSYMAGPDVPVESPAAADLIERAMSRPDPLYIVAIGAITNVASVLLLEPQIVEHAVVVWLGGQPVHWPTAEEFNIRQDPHASRLIFDCGVPLVYIPCSGVASHLLTTVPEIERHVEGRGPIGDYLARIFRDYHEDHFAWSKVIWDIACIGWCLNPEWVPTDVIPSPILTDQLSWRVDHSRHQIRGATYVHRDPIFGDLFKRLARASH